MKKKTVPEKFSYVGFVSRPHGFQGELLLAIENGDAEDYQTVKFIFIELEGKPVPFFIEEIKMNGQHVIVKLEDINTEADARKLTSRKLFIEEDEAIAFESEISWDDFIGYLVIDKVQGPLGPLEKVEEYPQQFIGHCTLNEKEILFPLTEELIIEVNDEKKEIHLDLPEGLLDVYLK